jgi:mannose-6-phosphate isomerase-like protein (cupin superfamily)
LIKNGNSLFNSLATHLNGLQRQPPGHGNFLERLIPQITASDLSFNAAKPGGISPASSLDAIFSDNNNWHSSGFLQHIHVLMPVCTWFRADQFYPEPEHESFSKHVWGTLVARQKDALFDTNDRYIALLILIDPHTIYPLHAHRIEEIYVLLSGHANWSHDDEHWITLSSGDTFHNSSYQPHTIRTFDQPLLAFGFYLPPFGWEGGLI